MKNQSFFARYFSFSGRMARRPFWIDVAIVVPVMLLSSAGSFLLMYLVEDPNTASWAGVIIFGILNFGLLIHLLSIGCRRYHDIGKGTIEFFSYALLAIILSFVPWVGWIGTLIVIIKLAIQMTGESEERHNCYGPVPESSPAEKSDEVSHPADTENTQTDNVNMN